MPTTSSDRLVWLDCEMTGLDLDHDELVEIACVVTEADLTPLDDGVSCVIKPSDAAMSHMPAIVQKMHTESGLLPEIPGGIDVDEAQTLVLDYVRSHVPTSRKAPLCGSSIYVDRGFLAKFMPDLDAHLHYRVVDVSSLKELVRRWYPKTYYASPAKTGNHRALGDTLDSIAELAYYRQAVMLPTPTET
ncbi:MAG: oligoribonuclease [Candidatus Nanopelagicales bacterium]